MRPNVILLGHSYVQRLSNYMERHHGSMGELGLHANVTVVAQGGATVERVHQEVRRNHSVDYADVVYLHVGENDYGRRPAHATARAIVSLAMFMLQQRGVGCVVIAELIRFPVHQTNWCCRVNRCLRRLIANVCEPGIVLWRQWREFSNPRSTVFDTRGVHLHNSCMMLYWQMVRQAVNVGLRRQ